MFGIGDVMATAHVSDGALQQTYNEEFSFNPKRDQDKDKLINNVKVFYNPIAEQVTINFSLSQQNTVVVKVMDALGNEVLNLLNSRLDEGMQSLSFDTEGKLSKGFYFVRVSSEAETVVKRISVR